MKAGRTDDKYFAVFLASDQRTQDDLENNRSTVQSCAAGSRPLRGRGE